ncbi:MAG TPA: hypothetical protein VMI53_00105 [Opitutaceae bacterium]|nr:hypothetical protein [Opitutaceae bacterium]
MKFSLPVIFSLFVLWAAPLVRAAAPPLVNLVGDDAVLVLYVTDAPSLVKHWPDTPWIKMWRDDQVKKYFAPLRAQMKVDEWDDRCKADTGYTIAELLDFATGQALIALPDLGTLLDAQKNKADPPVLIAIEVGDNAPKIEKLIAAAEAKDDQAKYTETTEDFGGITLHLTEATAKNETKPKSAGVWAMSGGVFYLSPSKEFLQRTLSAAKKGGCDNPLGQSDGFLRMQHRIGQPQLILYANLKGMYPAAQKALAEKKPAAGAGNPNPFAFDPTTLLPALGLDAANEFYLTASLDADAANLDFGLTYSERRGLTKLMAYADGAPPQPSFVPEKCFAVSTARFSLKNFYDATEEMLGNISPMFAGMFEGYVKSFNQRLGIDIRRDLIGSLGDQMVMANALNEAAPADAPINERLQPLYAFSVENAATLTTAMESIKHGLFGENADKVFEKRSYLGHDIYTYSPPQPPAAEGEPPPPQPKGFSYAVTDHWFFLGVGSAALVESALQGLDGKQASFWDKPEVKRNLLADLPDNASGFGYMDLGKIMPLYFDLFVQGIESSRKAAAMRKAAAQANADDNSSANGGAAAGEDADKPMVDADAKPDAATLAKYWSYLRNYAWHDANGIYATERIAYPKNNP